ncbi:acyl-CoA dehydrogenase [Halorientalis sp. IM1011]|uniref:acyl-CoA dehydrogenase family protein n=1 Tax=Halorientalis sp. IM1011 TaxID=1932360 RepID=UPI00097CCD02|nr:acyl-CoA dehydrogenase family protein [Halorientalis sp. IM1011]AQL42431.1 acyl-CoA dehydrogenase [Halorientalis sp. IM1011]
MRFQLTESQRTLRDEIRELAATEIEPVAADLDRTETYPEEILAALGERGITGLTLPEKRGGRGEGLVELVVVIEELAANQMALASAVGLNLGVATVIERFGSDRQRERWVPEMARFETVGALGLSEADAGSDKLAMETTAEREGEEWVLNGHKQWVTNFPNADVVLTYAKTGPEADAPHNISAFLVPAEAFEVDRDWDTLGANSVKSPRVTLSDVRVPDDAMVGERGEAYVQRGTVHTGVNVPARAVGIARAALEDAVAYTTEREQFDRAIGDFQGVRWRLGEMAERVDTSRLLTLRAADRADRGLSVDRAFPMAKVHATEAAVENANEAMQLHGGVGYTREHDVERYLRDARLLTIAGGPNEGHRDALADAVVDRETETTE